MILPHVSVESDDAVCDQPRHGSWQRYINMPATELLLALVTMQRMMLAEPTSQSAHNR